MAERQAHELRAFQQLARVVANSPFEAREILKGICAQVQQTFAFQRAMIARYRAEDATVHADIQLGVDWPGEQWLPLADYPFLERALATRETVLVRDPLGEQAMPEKIIERFGVRTIVAVPLTLEEECLGFLVADRAGDELELSEDDLALLTALGWVAAAFVAKAGDYSELQGAFSELLRHDRAQQDFVSLASHELRTPIAVVHGISSTLHLRGHELREDQLLELRETLFEQTARLRDLADQLLDLSRIDSERVPVRPERFRPRDRLDELLPRIAPDRLDDVNVLVQPELELNTDPNAFERIASNLIVNALHYGRPPVEVNAVVNGGFRLVVEDRGEGVTPEFVPRLFERFTRSDESRRSGFPGAGLGLAIAQTFAEALGGRLGYEPARPRGARFTLALPIEEAQVGTEAH
jgi:signal transduction histidine kinase